MHTVADQIAAAKGIWRKAPPAEVDSIAVLLAASPVELPDSYLNFLKFSNGGEGELGIQPGWFLAWPAEEVEEHNLGYQVSDQLPGLWAFGSNGGGELLAFDCRHGEPWPILMIPFIPMCIKEAVEVASTFDEFLGQIAKPMERT